MAQATLLKRGAYHDSVALLPGARALRARPGVREAAVVMGTPANRDLLAQAGLLTEEAGTAMPNDLVVVVDAETPAGAEAAAAAAEPLLARSAPRGQADRPRPRTTAGAIPRVPEANPAPISVPGALPALEARPAPFARPHALPFPANLGPAH